MGQCCCSLFRLLSGQSKYKAWNQVQGISSFWWLLNCAWLWVWALLCRFVFCFNISCNTVSSWEQSGIWLPSFWAVFQCWQLSSKYLVPTGRFSLLNPFPLWWLFQRLMQTQFLPSSTSVALIMWKIVVCVLHLNCFLLLLSKFRSAL